MRHAAIVERRGLPGRSDRAAGAAGVLVEPSPRRPTERHDATGGRQRWRRRWDCCIRERWAPWWARACARAAPASCGRRRAAARPAGGAREAADLEDLGTLAAVVAASDVILSVCPPGSAMDVARLVAAAAVRRALRRRECRRPGDRAPRGGDRGRRRGRAGRRRHHRPAAPRRRDDPALPRRSAGRGGREPVQGQRPRGRRDAGRRRHGLGSQDGVRRVDEGLERSAHRRARARDPRGGRRRAPRRVGALPARPWRRARSPRSPPTRRRPGGSSARWRRSRRRSPPRGCRPGSTRRAPRSMAVSTATRTRRRRRRSPRWPRRSAPRRTA